MCTVQTNGMFPFCDHRGVEARVSVCPKHKLASQKMTDFYFERLELCGQGKGCPLSA